MYVTHISDMPTTSDPHTPASHPHAGRLRLIVMSCKECLVGVDMAQCSQRAIHSHLIHLLPNVVSLFHIPVPLFKPMYPLVSSPV